MSATALNPNHISIDDHVQARLDECDYFTPDSPVPTVTVSGKNNRYAAVAEELAQKITRTHCIKVVGKTAYLYDSSTGCFHPIPNLPAWLYQSLDHEHRVKFRTRDLDEVATRLLFSPHVQANADDFNASPLKINLRNGIWDASIRKVSDHSSSSLFTYCIDANYRVRVNGKPPEHPNFDNFCETSLENDPLKKKLLLEILGAVLSDYPTKSAFFMLGESNSGKSVILSFISRLLSPEMLSSVPLHQLSSRFNLAELWGKKANISGEIKGKKLPDITVFKGITGSDLMQAERKGRDPFVFRPRAKLIFAGNILPDNSEMDKTDAFANRLIPLVFNVSIPKEKQDQNLLKKLCDERDAIVTDALNAFADWFERGCVWTFPSDSIRVINRFRHVLRSDKLFIQDCCVMGSKNFVFNCDLKRAYRDWCDENGFTPVPIEDLYTTLDHLPGVERVRLYDSEGHRRHGRRGISVITQ